MSDLQYLIEAHSKKNLSTLKKICAPLDYLSIPIFDYYRINEDGTFGSITNCPEHLDTYYKEKQYLINPYLTHPMHFRSGSCIVPISFHPDYVENMQKRYGVYHYLMLLSHKGDHVEAFLFARQNSDPASLIDLLSKIDMLQKFGGYFKRQAKKLIANMMGDQFNLKKERGNKFLKPDTSLPLSTKNQNVINFFKDVYPLSFQERRCLELYKLGYSAQATAAILGLSTRTVESYFNSIKYKLNCSSKMELLEA